MYSSMLCGAWRWSPRAPSRTSTTTNNNNNNDNNNNN